MAGLRKGRVKAIFKLSIGRPVLHAGAVAAVVGFTAIAGQIVLMREVLVLYNGNELSLGIVLGAWMIWTAVGSGLIGQMYRRLRNHGYTIAAFECMLGPTLLGTVIALRASRAYLQVVPGELLGPAPLVLVAMSCLGLFCTLCGCLFTLAARMYSQEIPAHEASSYAYCLESAGSALGGILTSVLLLCHFGSFQIAAILTAVNVCMASILLFKRPRTRVLAAGFAAIVAIAGAVKLVPGMEVTTHRWLWKGFDLVTSRESIYGQITILNSGGMHSIYESGSIVANVPDRAAAEETIHYAMLEHPTPRRVLLIGGGMNGSIGEALKYPTLERLDYVELDPELITMYRQFFPAEAGPMFSDPRVHLHAVDGRSYLKSTNESFDEVILSTPDPDNAQLNRFYTVEFFQLACKHLATGGVFSLQLRSSEETIGPELREFLRCIHKGLKRTFRFVAVIPGDTLHLFGSESPGVLTEDPQMLVERLRSSGIETMYVRDYAIPFRMMPDRMEQIHAILSGGDSVTANRDFHPVAYYFGTVLWSAQFKSTSAQALESAARIRFRTILLFVAGSSAIILLLWLMKSHGRTSTGAGWSIIAAGFTLMSLQILLLLAFQSIYGFVYHELAMLVGMFMAGIALGCLVGIRRIHASSAHATAKALGINQTLLAISAPLLIGIGAILAQISSANLTALTTWIAFPALSLVCGVLGGIQFPIASKLYQHGREERGGYGTLYALDVAGGCIGALLLTGFLIPLFGFWNTAWITTVVNATPALALLSTELSVATISPR